MAPYDAEGLDWTAGMASGSVDEYNLTLAGPDALAAYLDQAAAVVGQATGEAMAPVMRSQGFPEIDCAALSGELAEEIAATFRRSVSTGVAGWRDDDLATVKPWGFDLATIQVPVGVWQGKEGRGVPLSHALWLADRIPSATLHLLDGEAHITMVARRIGDILDELVSVRDRESAVTRA